MKEQEKRPSLKPQSILFALLLLTGCTPSASSKEYDPTVSPPSISNPANKQITETLFMFPTSYAIAAETAPEGLRWTEVTAEKQRFLIGDVFVELSQMKPNEVTILWFDQQDQGIGSTPVWLRADGAWVLSSGIQGLPYDFHDPIIAKIGFSCGEAFIYLRQDNGFGWEVGIPEGTGKCDAIKPLK